MRHLLAFAAVVACIVALWFWTQSGTVAVDGRVLLRDMDGSERAGAGAKVAWRPAEVVDRQLRAWLEAHDEWRRDNELRIRAARNEWNQKVASRDEAARILRVAERGNAADLQICRARHREAAADAEDALRNLEKILAAAEEAADPARFLTGLPAPAVEFAADADGRFSMHVPHGAKGYITAWVEEAGERKELLLWLQFAHPEEKEPLLFSNENIQTTASLARFARELKKNRGTSEGSPVVPSAR